ncbi:carph-isopro domain-containing protein [Algihabitans albus]|uniref:carph-isopro domain-containing protein n=1 Tax=Algihabitans albus TaxID=2164067 RepID=UPI0035D01C66
MEQVNEVVRRFGGAAALADELGLGTTKAVEQWIRRGHIPGKWHLTLLEMARDRGVSLTAEELLSATSLNRAS